MTKTYPKVLMSPMFLSVRKKIRKKSFFSVSWGDCPLNIFYMTISIIKVCWISCTPRKCCGVTSYANSDMIYLLSQIITPFVYIHLWLSYKRYYVLKKNFSNYLFTFYCKWDFVCWLADNFRKGQRSSESRTKNDPKPKKTTSKSLIN